MIFSVAKQNLASLGDSSSDDIDYQKTQYNCGSPDTSTRSPSFSLLRRRFYSPHFNSFRRSGEKKKKDEAHCKDYHIAGGYCSVVDWSLADVYSSSWLCLVASDLFGCVSWMLWSIDGWSWSHAISNLSSGSCTLAAGHS